MKKQPFDDWLIHASAFQKLTTQPKSAEARAKGELSETTKTFLREAYREETTGRKKEINTKQMEKGIQQEEAAITLYCRFTKKLWVKNTERLTNEFVTGEPDLTDNEDILKTFEGVDIKCSWSIFSFPFPDDKLDPVYECQNQNYMYLTGANRWKTAHCLVNASGQQVLDEKRKAFYKCGSPEQDDLNYPLYLNKAIEIEKNMIFNMAEFRKENPNFDYDCKEWKFDIPLEKRVVEFLSIRDELAIQSVGVLVPKARLYMNWLYKQGY